VVFVAQGFTEADMTKRLIVELLYDPLLNVDALL
jgi:hypothetical protein